jgi:hypothetical protein
VKKKKKKKRIALNAQPKVVTRMKKKNTGHSK